MKIMTRLVTIALILIVIVIGGAIAFLLTFNLNNLKPTIQKAAKEHQLNIDIPGDLSWQFWPSLKINLGAMTISSLTDTQVHLASINAATVALQLKPLLQKQIKVDGIHFDGVQVQYLIDQQGRSNWQSLLDSLEAQPSPESDPDTDSGSADSPSVNIRSFSLTNLKLEYTNQQDGSQLSVTETNLYSSNIRLDGASFPLELNTSIHYTGLPPLTVAFNSEIQLNLSTSQLQIDDGKFSLNTPSGALNLLLTSATQWAPELTSKGAIELSSKNLKSVLNDFADPDIETLANDVLQRFKLNFQYDYTGNQANLQNITIALDKTALTGNILIADVSQPVVRSQWQGTRIDLTQYLPPATETPTPPPSPTEIPPTPIPFEFLQKLDAEFSLQFEEIQHDKIIAKNIALETQAKKGLLSLNTFNVEVAEGKIIGQGFLDARKKPAKLDLNIDSNAVNIGHLVNTFVEKNNIAGKLSAEAHITSQGNTDQELIDGLTANAQALSDGLMLIPFNLEQQFCNAIAILQKQQPKEYDWPKQTLMEPVRMQVNFQNQTLQLESLTAQLANLLSSAEGKFNLAKGSFDIPFSLSVGDFAETIPGCLPIEDKWRERALPIRCKGSLDDIGVKTCLPDTKLLTNMIKEKAKAKLEEEQNRAEKKLKNKAKELLKKELGDEKSKNAEDAVRGIFDQLKGR